MTFKNTTGNVGIGNTNPTLAGLQVDKLIGNTAAMFGTGTPGLSIVSNWPGVYFNSYFNANPLFMGSGYAGLINFIPTSGDITIGGSTTSGTAGGTVSWNTAIYIKNGSGVGISNGSPAHLLHVGSSSASGVVAELQNSSGACTYTPGASSVTVSCSSDMRFKRDVADSENAMAWVNDMRVRDFTVKATGERRTGVVAQEVSITHPELVHTDADGFYTVDEPNPWKLVKALQEQQAEIDALKQTIEQLKQSK